MRIGYPLSWRRAASSMTPADAELLRLLHALPDDLQQAIIAIIVERGHRAELEPDPDFSGDPAPASDR